MAYLSYLSLLSRTGMVCYIAPCVPNYAKYNIGILENQWERKYN